MRAIAVYDCTVMLTGKVIRAPLAGIKPPNCREQVKKMPTLTSSLRFFSSEKLL
jgi:hypothetical protein